MGEEKELNELLSSAADEKAKEKASVRLGEVHQLLLDIDAETGPTRAAELLYGLGFTSDDQVCTSDCILSHIEKYVSL